MRRQAHRCLVALAVVTGALAAGGPAAARAATRSVRYRGYVIRVPRSWPVYDLRRDPAVCVRFDRHALYLGTPGANQRCPAHAVGRTEAILVEPLTRGSQATEGSAQVLELPRQRLLVAAAWSSDPATVERALDIRSLRALHAPRIARFRRQSVLARPAQVAGGVYTGLGFDACSAPSAAAMSAWGSSPYRALGVYIGGTNMACSQANLTSAWVSAETSAGWHLIPTYVGLQAPHGCCKAMSSNAGTASAQGTAAASDAVAHAQSIGIGPGNPIYYDMEAYPRGGTTTSAVLAFLSAWTAQLHADSYLSGVYSSGGSGITDLAAQVGTGYLEPDDIWIADWNGLQTTSDPYVPSGDWASHQRLHQYEGAHNETYGGVTINIDGDYLDGATAGEGATGSAPLNTAPPSIAGVASFGQTLSISPGAWAGTSPVSYSYRWQLCSRTCANIGGAVGQTYKLVAADIGARVRVMVSASNFAGHAQAISSEIGPVAPTGYWLFTAAGNVYGSVGTRAFGSPAAVHARRPQIVGMAASVDGGGYWLAGASGRMWTFGDAARLGWTRRSQTVAGIAADPAGGYWLFTGSGTVYRSGGARWFGSPAAVHARGPQIVGMAPSADGGGYWLVGASGRVWRFGDAARLGWSPRPQPVAGIAADPAGGYWLFTGSGSVYASPGTHWYGSPAASRARRPAIVAMAATPDGRGYWLVGASGRVWTYGDAARLPALRHSGPIVGIAGP